MNVLFLSQIVPYPPHGGVLQRGYNLIRELNNHHDVHLLAFHHPDALPAEELQSAREHLAGFCASVETFPLWPKAHPLLRLPAFLLGALSTQPFGALAYRSRAFSAAIDRHLQQSDIDVVHVDTITLAPFLRQGSPPALLTHHNIESQLFARRAAAERNPLARAYVAREARKLEEFERRFCPRFSRNVTVSDADAATLTRMLPGLNCVVVPNGVDCSYFAARPDAAEPRLIYTGGLNMFANLDAVDYFLNEVWPTIRAAVPDARFVIIGQDPPQRLLALAKEESGIDVTGYVDDVRPYVADASVYVVPLRVGGGTRLKVLDAMAQGKAIVSTSIGCEGIDVDPGRDLLVADDAADFARRVIELLNDSQARRRLGNEARRTVEARYQWSAIATVLARAYEEVAGTTEP